MLCEKSLRALALCLAFPDVWQLVLKAFGRPECGRQMAIAPAWCVCSWASGFVAILNVPAYAARSLLHFFFDQEIPFRNAAI